MKELTESQTNLIIKWVRSHNLTIRSLENEFIDHICCDVESLIDDGRKFEDAFVSVRGYLGDDILICLEKQTILKLTYNTRLMKLITRITGILVLVSFIASIAMKLIGVQSWKVFLVGGLFVLSLGFVPLFFIDQFNQQKEKSERVLHFFGFLAAFFIPVSVILRIYYSPYAVLAMISGLFFLLVGFIPLFWLSIPKGSGRTAFSGSILILVFFILLSYGFFGVRISKDVVDHWVYIAGNTQQTAGNLNKMTEPYLLDLYNNPIYAKQAQELKSKSDALVQKIGGLKTFFINSLSPSSKPGDKVFKGMDDPYAGRKYLIDNSATGQLLKEYLEYKDFLMSVLSDENDKEKDKISDLLGLKYTESGDGFISQKNYYFRDFPAIMDVSVLNSLEITIRAAEYRTLKFLVNENKKNLNYPKS